MNRSSRGFAAVALVCLVAMMLLHLAAGAGISRAWNAMVAVGLLGWASGMIFAVSYHVMPVFLARDFPPDTPITGHLAIFTVAVVWLTVALLLPHPLATAVGYSLHAVAGICFVMNLMQLLRRGIQRPGGVTPPPFPQQAVVDRAAIQATRLAPVGLVGAPLLLAAVYARLLPGSWFLAGEHWVVLGWLMPMMMGVAYHILPRFSQKMVRREQWVPIQMALHWMAAAGIVIGLGAAIPPLFAVGAFLEGSSLLFFLWQISPMMTPYRPAPFARAIMPVQEGKV